jgi:aconitate hydratase
MAARAVADAAAAAEENRRRSVARTQRHRAKERFGVDPDKYLDHGSVVIAAITSCTNTSNPSVMMAAGLLAKKAVEKGLTVPPWVKTSLAPGSRVVTDYYAKGRPAALSRKAALQRGRLRLHHLHRQLRPAARRRFKSIDEHGLVAVSVLSGNRNFEGRVNVDVRANYLMSPPLVVAYALAGSIGHNFDTDPLGNGSSRPARLPQGHLAHAGRGGRGH